ncbi:MAG TPA: NAD(P)/FAD-dependent oxidoreductase [Solirubrobacteraceae bacterium]|nr:NAD(P)/FAD-dependent oxidoreductase [Solirubrobacteraceae bacterium]
MRTTSDEQTLDVLVIGAGLSGIGAGCHLRRALPHKTFAILEARDAIGGTWDLFRYPGIRSDSDMHTLGYAFSPWRDQRAIADGPSILRYVRETADRHGITERVRFGHRVLAADWSEQEACWTVDAERAGGERVTFRCSFLLTCCGYYDYENGHAPRFPGQEDFAGRIVHPQHWPEDLDYAGRRVVVIGSGATAITLVPAMAGEAGHVTMLQRSPTYLISLPGTDPIAARLRRWLPEQTSYTAIRAKNVATQAVWYWFCRRFPRQARALIRRGAVAQLPPGFDVDRHLSPDYDPWTQRMCVSPDGDLFKAVRDGRASIVTDRIARLTPGGIALESGEELPADIIVTATGLRLKAMGGMRLSLDGAPVDIGQTIAYRGSMLSGIPNFAFAIGYTNASWTLKADLTSEYVCRVIAHMDAHGYTSCRPPADPPGIEREPVIDLKSGYVLRALDELPDQGSVRPWKLRQNYPLDRYEFTRKPVDDGVLVFSRGARARTPGPAGAAATV